MSSSFTQLKTCLCVAIMQKGLPTAMCIFAIVLFAVIQSKSRLNAHSSTFKLFCCLTCIYFDCIYMLSEMLDRTITMYVYESCSTQTIFIYGIFKFFRISINSYFIYLSIQIRPKFLSTLFFIMRNALHKYTANKVDNDTNGPNTVLFECNFYTNIQ